MFDTMRRKRGITMELSVKVVRMVILVVVIVTFSAFIANKLAGGVVGDSSQILQSDPVQSEKQPYSISAKEVRSRADEDPGPYLGYGAIPTFFDKLSIKEAQYLIHSKITDTPFKCKMDRLGKKGDGGYYVCVSEPFALKPGCLVYSFGINNEWSFDEAMNTQFGCEVHSFDPSMGVEDHVHRPNMYFHNLGLWGSNMKNEMDWELRDLKTIIKMLNHENRVIDYLKIDVEGAEWSVVEHIIQSGVHTQIRQMALELHTPRLKDENMTLTDYGEVFNSQHQLDSVGFEKYLYQSNNGCCGRFATLTPKPLVRPTLCCYETFYINKNFL